MPISRCPRCNAALTEAESRLRSCPACGGAPSGRAPAVRAPFVLGIVALLGATLVAGSLVAWGARPKRGDRPAAERLPARAFVAPEKAVVFQKKPVHVAEVLEAPEVERDDSSRAEALPAPEVEQDSPRLEALPAPQVEAAAERPKGREVLRGNDIVLARPDGDVTLAPIDGDEKTTVSGRVRVLTIEGVNGKVVLDASKLNADRVVVKGEINGSTKVILHGTDIEFAGPINGDADVIADGGKVAFTSKTPINGSCRVNVTARKATFAGVVGGVRVLVTLSSGGELSFGYLDGGAVLEYRKASGKDGEPKVTRGEVKGGSRFGESK